MQYFAGSRGHQAQASSPASWPALLRRPLLPADHWLRGIGRMRICGPTPMRGWWSRRCPESAAPRARLAIKPFVTLALLGAASQGAVRVVVLEPFGFE